MTTSPAEPPESTLAAVLAELGVCPFIENVRDGSMCVCGLPALNHDETASHIVLADHPAIAAILAATDARTIHDAARIARLEADLAAAASLHRDLVSRLGFGNNITEPMADNDTVVKWFEERSREADEWRESQLWRDDCHFMGHPDDEDCFICDPRLRLERAEADLAAALAKLAAARLALAAVRDVRLEGHGLSNLEAGSTQPAP